MIFIWVFEILCSAVDKAVKRVNPSFLRAVSGADLRTKKICVLLRIGVEERVLRRALLVVEDALV